MAKQTRNTLKGYFETGKKPTGNNYADLLDSYLLVDGENTGSIDIQGHITVQGSITASGDISASGTIFADTFQSHGSTEIGVSDSLNVTGGITASNISSSGYVSASEFIGDGSGLTNITASSLSIQQITASYLSGSIQATGSLTYTSGSTNVLYGIQSSGSIIPDSSNAWDLGGPSNTWKDLFLNGNVSASGNIIGNTLSTDEKINHNGDTNTFIHFDDDRIRFTAGNLNLFVMQKKSYAPHQVTVNNAGNNVDFVVKDNSNNVILQTDASTRRLGINQSSPGEALEVVGNISASGTTTSLSGSFTHLTSVNTSGNISASGKVSSSGGFETDNSASFGHISASGDLKIDGFASFGGFGNVQSMSSTTSVPANTNMLLYGPITIGTSATLNIAVDSQVLVKDLLNA